MKRLLMMVLTVALTGVAAMASTGKLTGVVKDKKTGEAIIGANIILEGTYYGAAANLDGKYTIFNVPVGEYTIIASAVGYQKLRITKVMIKNNLTTNQDILMDSEDIFLDQEVVVEAEAPLVQKDLTSSAVTVSSAELKTMPVENLAQVINLQAGVVDGHFRGGRRNEVGYLIDGIPVTDVFSSGQGIQVENNSVRQLEVISGTFNAEYGQAMSGIVNIVTNDGDAQFYHSSFQGYVGSYYSTDKLYKNIDRIAGFQSRDLQASFSGPVPILKNLSFFGSGRYFADEGYYYGQRIYRPQDANTQTNPSNLPTGDSSWVPMSPYELISGNLKFTWQIPEFKVSFNSFLESNYSQGYNHVKKYSPDGRIKNFKTSYVNTIQLSHIPNDRVYHVTSISLGSYNYKGYAYEDGFDSRYVSPGFGAPPAEDLFWKGGTENDRYNRFTNTIIGKWQLTAQLDDIHKLGMGFEGKYHHLYTRNSFLNSRDEDFDLDQVIDTTVFYYFPLHTGNNKGYRRIPWEFSAYIQDKIEYDIMIINLGLRFDYFEPNTKVVTDVRNPDRNKNFPGSGSLVDADVQYQISPRFGVSFPITDEGVIHFSYGHFFQIPPFENIYQNNDLPVYSNQLNTIYGNGNLKAQKTVMYELGLQQVLPFNIKLDATVYYRDIRDLIGVEIINTYYASYYGRFINKDYGNVRGLIFSLDRRMSDLFSISMDYTYQIAKGNSSDPYSAIYYYNSKLEPEKLLRPLDWDQRSTLNMVLTTGQEDWNVSTIIGYGTGFPFTPDPIYSSGFRFLNDGIKPSTWSLDVRAEKRWDLGGVQVSSFLLIYNLLGIKNEYGVFGSTGRANKDLYGEQQTRPVVGDEIYNDYLLDPSRYSSPRNIKIGFSFSL